MVKRKRGRVGALSAREAGGEPRWSDEPHVRQLRVGAAAQVLLARRGVGNEVCAIALENAYVPTALALDERLDASAVVVCE